MSKKAIFTDIRNGGSSAGRKANLLVSMVKKAEANLQNHDKNEPSPFSGYSFSSNQLATSQVSQGFSISTTNIETIKTTVQDEIEKYLGKVLNERITKILVQKQKQQQLTNQTLNSQIQTMHKSFERVVQGYQQKNKQLFNTFETARIKHDEMTLNNLKIFIGLMKEQLTKQFVPMKMLEELDFIKLIQNCEDRIEVLEKIPHGQKEKEKKVEGNEIVLAKEIQINLNKTMKELELLKKNVGMLVQEKNSIKTDILTINKSIVDITMRNDQQASKIDVINKKTTQQLTNQLAKLKSQLEDNTTKLTKNIEQLKSAPTLSQLKSFESVQQKLADFKLQDQSITHSISIPSIYQPDPAIIKSSITNSQINKGIQQPSSPNLYQIDAQGLLMDQFGQYILDSEGGFIMLSPEQIKTLKQSNMLVD